MILELAMRYVYALLPFFLRKVRLLRWIFPLNCVPATIL
jgi:hypothetical protein